MIVSVCVLYCRYHHRGLGSGTFQTLCLYFQNQFLSHSWLRCHWSHGGHPPPSRVVRQPPQTEKWSFLDWRGIWTEIAWHRHLFGSGEYGQTATRWLLWGRARTVARSDWTLIPHRRRKAGIPDLQQFVNMFSWPWCPPGFNGNSVILPQWTPRHFRGTTISFKAIISCKWRSYLAHSHFGSFPQSPPPSGAERARPA